MYSLIWRLLPGPTALKVVLALILAVAVFFLLMEVVFPWVSSLMPYTEVSVS
ncbi:hypothetical protein [Corynebacterium caspium]|uniref:hypothetical protein n=1 Tax=Corynebacterium caspium TaxID=234828 RepID=UPI0003811736|nr:hypothetical protein [Corynebacterium caspium]WKD60012.1 hypothetical protein CCASP_08185 [Corynebacterium caspium DSM 44850]